MISVLVVEDSKVTRDYLVYLLESDPDLRVAGTADSGEAALEFLERNHADAVLMDIHLPGIDGLETTRRIMSSNPVPVVVCTGSTSYGELHTAMRALEAGALSVTRKPRGVDDPRAGSDAAAIISSLKLMSEVKVVRRWTRVPTSGATVPVAIPESAPAAQAVRAASVVAIGASTGGPPALRSILSGLTPGFSLPILVVQHIASGFTEGFAEWLGSVSGLRVHVARAGEQPQPGHVYVAPDDMHLCVGIHGVLHITREAPCHGLRPSIDVLFRSVAERFGRRAVGVLLTGMGRDGADGLRLLADRGALTVAQDKDSSVVFGMPAEAIKLGAAQHVLPPGRIAELLSASVGRGTKGGGIRGQ